MNYYQILGISRNATENEIKQAYKALAKRYHPDVYPGDSTFAEKRMKEINSAYETLSDPKKKSKYDSTLNGYTYQTTYTNKTSYDDIYKKYAQKNGSDFSEKFHFKNHRYTYNNTKQENDFDPAYDRTHFDLHQFLSTNLMKHGFLLFFVIVFLIFNVLFVVVNDLKYTVSNYSSNHSSSSSENHIIEDSPTTPSENQVLPSDQDSDSSSDSTNTYGYNSVKSYQGIEIGQTTDDVRAILGEAFFVHQEFNYTFWLYPDVFFVFDENNTIVEIIIQ